MSYGKSFSMKQIPDGYSAICPICDKRHGAASYGVRVLDMSLCPKCLESRRLTKAGDKDHNNRPGQVVRLHSNGLRLFPGR